MNTIRSSYVAEVQKLHRYMDVTYQNSAGVVVEEQISSSQLCEST